MERGLISFFELTHCGFYRIRSKKDGEHVEGSLAETVQLVKKWLEGKDVSQTIPWDIEASQNRTQIYCKSVHTDDVTGDSLFVFWKKFSDDSGNVSGILADSKVGSKKGDSVKVGKDVNGKPVILGQPLYYWFIPEHNIIASIKFPHSLAASESIYDYFKRCIDLRIAHPRKVTHEQDHFNQFSGKQITTKSVCYRSEDKKYSMKFKFHGQTKELSIKNVDVERLSATISHIVVRDTISTLKRDDKDFIFQLWDKVTRKQQEKYYKKQVEIVSEANLNAKELESLLTVYCEEYDPTVEDWNNVGFKTDGKDGTTKWFNRYVDRAHILLDPLEKEDGNYFPSDKVLNVLVDQREHLLRPLFEVQEQKKEEEVQAELDEVVGGQ